MTVASRSLAALGAGLLGFALVTPTFAETPAEESARAIAFTADACKCLFENYDAVNKSSTGMKICIDSATKTHGIPANPSGKYTMKLDGVTVTVPKLFTSEEANRAHAANQHACNVRFGGALAKYQGRTWDEEGICSSQCADEGPMQSLCSSVCLAARLPSETGSADSCKDKCAKLEGRSKYACEKSCE